MKKYYSLIVGELTPFAAVFGVIIWFGLAVTDFAENMILPGGDLVDQMTVRMVIGGFVLGALILGWDESRGSLDYVRHRGLSYLRQQYAHHAASATVLLGLHLVLLSLWLGYQALVRGTAIADWSRVLPLGLTGVAGLTGYALGFWVTSLPWNATGRSVVGLFSSLALFILLRDQVEISVTGNTGNPATFLALNLFIAGALLLAGHHALSLNRDPDHPLPTRGALIQGVLVALVLAAAAGGAAREIQEGRLVVLASHYPSVGSVPSGDRREPVMLANHVVGEEGLVAVDDERRPRDDVDQSEIQFHFMPWRHWIRCRAADFEALALDNRNVLDEGFPFEGPYEKAVDANGWNGWLNRGDRQIELIHLGSGSQAKSALSPEGGFSDLARVLRPADDGLPAILLDQGSVYSVEVSPTPALKKLPLGGAPITRFGIHRDTVLLDDESGIWEIGEGEPVRLDGRELATAERRVERDETERDQEEFMAHATADPIEFEVTTHIGGEDHVVTYGPTTRTEKIASWVMRGATLLRPPALIVLSHGSSLSENPWELWTFERAWFTDPLVAGGKRVGWVVASLILAVLMVWFQWRTMRSYGVPTSRCRVWAGLTLLLGPSGFLTGLLVDSKTAWRWVGVDFEKAPPPRIVSEAA